MKRLLVTGISGLLGLNLAWLASDRFHVTGVMRGARAAIRPGCDMPFETLLADLTEAGSLERVLETAQPDLVIHCAALTEVDRCELRPEEAYRLNAHLPSQLARLTAQHGVRLLHISTDSVFDGQRGDYTETDTPCPINVYAQSKLLGEHGVAEANPDALIARVNFYGWSWQGSRSLAEWFFNHLSVGRAVGGFEDIVFCPLLVNDIVEILLAMLANDLNGLYHVASPEALNKYEFGRMLARAFGFDENLLYPISYKMGGLRAPRSPLLTLRSDKLAAALGTVLPGQQSAMEQFYGLHCQGYPETLRSLFAHPDDTRAVSKL